MIEEGKDRGVPGNSQSQYYGTFQGVANYYPPSPKPPPYKVVSFPQLVAPHGCTVNSQCDSHEGYAVTEERPLSEHRLPCGLGMGWFSFIIGFLLGGIPWYVATGVLLCVEVDDREKPGYVACAIASILVMIAVIGVNKGAITW